MFLRSEWFSEFFLRVFASISRISWSSLVRVPFISLPLYALPLSATADDCRGSGMSPSGRLWRSTHLSVPGSYLSINVRMVGFSIRTSPSLQNTSFCIWAEKIELSLLFCSQPWSGPVRRVLRASARVPPRRLDHLPPRTSRRLPPDPGTTLRRLPLVQGVETHPADPEPAAPAASRLERNIPGRKSGPRCPELSAGCWKRSSGAGYPSPDRWLHCSAVRSCQTWPLLRWSSELLLGYSWWDKKTT